MKPADHRLQSLDAFRGITIAGMILVNNPGSWDTVYPLLVHADWNGCTLADLVFPFFIFIMGVAMPFAFSRRLSSGPARAGLRRHIWRRAGSLVALGLVLNVVAALPAAGQLRIPGVLQRIGIVYLIAAFVVLHAGTAARLGIAAAILAGHWALLVLVPFGGHAAGVVAPDHNLAGMIDKAVFGAHTLTPAGDPEGLLGTAPAVASALFGSIAGDWLRSCDTAARRIGGLAAGGGAALLLGLVWSRAWPLNKPLWTGSFTLVTAGLGALLFALCFLLIDVWRVRRWARPFVWLGVNPLAIYFLAEFVGHLMDRPWVPDGAEWTTAKSWLFWTVLQPRIAPPLGDAGASLAFAVLTVLAWTLVAGVLYRRDVRIQV
ncbi:MAG: acyltransferase family protein [Betaproteobacteria bacterium]